MNEQMALFTHFMQYGWLSEISSYTNAGISFSNQKERESSVSFSSPKDNTSMPSLEIIAEQAPKDLDAFCKNLSGLFSQCIGKPESVSHDRVVWELRTL